VDQYSIDRSDFADRPDSGFKSIVRLVHGDMDLRFPVGLLIVLNLLLFAFMCFKFGSISATDGMTDIQRLNYHQTQIELIKAKHEED
jgi:hypothetical protein